MTAVVTGQHHSHQIHTQFCQNIYLSMLREITGAHLRVL